MGSRLAPKHAVRCFGGLHARHDAQHGSTLVGSRDDSVLVRTQADANPGTLRGDRRSGNSADLLHGIEAVGTRAVQANTSIVGDQPTGSHAQRILRHDLAAMRGDTEDVVWMLPADSRERPDGENPSEFGTMDLGDVLVDKSGQIQGTPTRGTQHQFPGFTACHAWTHTERLRGLVGVADSPGDQAHPVGQASLHRRHSGSERLPELPNVPTVKEAGIPDFVVESVIGIVTPANLPPAVHARLSGAIDAILSDAAVREAIAKTGSGVPPIGKSEFQQRLRADAERWRRVIREAGITGS